MLKSYFQVAVRTLRKRPLYSSINFLGLALGLACALSVYALVSHERDFDAYHTQAERTYRVGSFWPDWDEDGASYQAQTPTGLVPLLREGVPGVERVAELRVGYGERSVNADGRFFTQDGIVSVGPDYFEVFDYDVREGGLARLDEPETVVLTATTARRYFGERAAVGQSLRLGDTRVLEVVGVVGDPPAQTHLPFAFFVSRATSKPGYEEWGFSDGHSAYVVLAPHAVPADVERQLNAIRVAHQSEEEQAAQRFLLQPLAAIHTEPQYGAYPGSYVMSPTALWVLGVIGLLILLSAVVNYVNLATAQGAARAREIGVRKAIGGARGQVVTQLLSETGLLTIMAVGLGWLAAYAALPAVGRVFEIEVARSILLRPRAIAFVIGSAFVVTVLAGLYPAAILSGVRPTVTLRGAGGGRVGAARFRRGLIVFQFAATLTLLVGTLVVLQQMRYVEGKDLGFEREARLLVRVPDDEGARERFRQAALQAPGVQHVTFAMGGPTKSGRLNQRYSWDGAPEAESIQTIPADAAYADAFGLRVIAGRGLRPGDETEPHSRVALVNRAMAERMGFAEPGQAVGAVLTGEGGDDALEPLAVVGVVEDFHHGSLHSQIDPSVLLFWPRWSGWAGVALASGREADGLEQAETAFAESFPNTHFRYEFLDEYMAGLYAGERRIASAFRAFTALSVVIACLGLFGLAALMAAQRRREIGVRKVLGASVLSIVSLLSAEVARLVLIAFAVAAPIAYVLIRRWLDGFAYRIDLGVGLFLFAGAAVLLTAMLTVGSQALRAATADPVRALRSD